MVETSKITRRVERFDGGFRHAGLPPSAAEALRVDRRAGRMGVDGFLDWGAHATAATVRDEL